MTSHTHTHLTIITPPAHTHTHITTPRHTHSRTAHVPRTGRTEFNSSCHCHRKRELFSLFWTRCLLCFLLTKTKQNKNNFCSCLCESEMRMDSWASRLAANKLPSSWRDNNTALQRLGRPHLKVNVQNVKQRYKKHVDSDFRHVVGQKQNALTAPPPSLRVCRALKSVLFFP